MTKEVKIELLPAQQLVMQSNAKEILFAGTRGNGKTWLAIIWAFWEFYVHKVHGVNVLVLRKDLQDLNEFINLTMSLLTKWGIKSKYRRNQNIIEFENNCKIFFKHMKDYTPVQGYEIQRIILEEATQIPNDDIYLKILGSLRTSVRYQDIYTGKDVLFETQTLLTANTGGAGEDWVYERFVAGSEVNKKTVYYPAKDIEDKVFYTPNKDLSTDDKLKTTRLYVFGKLEDNPYLKDDVGYRAILNQQKGDTREQWLYGKWNVSRFKGSVFGDLMSILEGEGRISNYPIEPNLKTYCAWDLGVNIQSGKTSIWMAQVSGKNINVIWCYENDDKGIMHYKNVIKEFCIKYGISIEKHYLPHDVNKSDYGVNDIVNRADNFRKAGIDFKVLKRFKTANDKLELAKEILPRCHFKSHYCNKGIRALKRAIRKKDSKTDSFTGLERNEYTDFVDSFSYLAQAFRHYIDIESNKEYRMESIRPRAVTGSTYFKGISRPTKSRSW